MRGECEESVRVGSLRQQRLLQEVAFEWEEQAGEQTVCREVKRKTSLLNVGETETIRQMQLYYREGWLMEIESPRKKSAI